MFTVLRWYALGQHTILPRSHVTNDRLPAITNVDVFDADILVTTVPQATKGLDLHGIGPQQASRS
jgi:hypothetical protein